MSIENSSAEILTLSVFWFISKKKTRFGRYLRKSFREMPISKICASPQNNNYMRFKTKKMYPARRIFKPYAI